MCSGVTPFAESVGDTVSSRHRASRGARPVELRRTHRVGDDLHGAFILLPFIRRPGTTRSLHGGIGDSDESRGAAELTTFCGHRRQSIHLPRDGHVVAAPAIDLQRFAPERLSSIEISELALDHAEIAGFRADGREVARFSPDGDALAHQIAGFEKVSSHLRRDREDVHRARAPGSVRRALGDCDGLATELPRFVDVGSQRDPRQTNEGQR